MYIEINLFVYKLLCLVEDREEKKLLENEAFEKGTRIPKDNFFKTLINKIGDNTGFILGCRPLVYNEKNKLYYTKKYIQILENNSEKDELKQTIYEGNTSFKSFINSFYILFKT